MMKNGVLMCLYDEEQCAAVVESVRSEAAAIRTELLAVLEHALCGDRLAAEFLLCHLISTVLVL